MIVKAAQKIYLQGRSTLPSMSSKTDGRLSTMTTQDEAGNIRAFSLRTTPTEVWGERLNFRPSLYEMFKDLDSHMKFFSQRSQLTFYFTFH